jgi:hypothetical protein
MAKNGEKSEYQVKPGGQFKEGNPGGGRPKGSQSFSVLYKKAIAKIAESKGVTPEDFEVQLVTQAITKGFNGDRSFYADTMDRVHGKAPQTMDHNVEGNIVFVLSDVIANKNGIDTQAKGDS